MSGLFNQASLVLVPSGYKAGKVYSQVPTNGDGDLTFTRASSATRVNSDGLIEKVRTNLILQSNQFDTTWTINGSGTLTSGQGGYDGTNNAWKFDKSASSTYLLQPTTSLGINTFSIYAKAGTNTHIAFWIRNANRGKFFDLANGTVGSDFIGTPIDAQIQSMGNGWYRCSVTTNDASNNCRIYPADADGDVSGTSGNIYIQNAQLETGDIATDYIPTTTTAVSVGMTANVPRLDYSQGSCPALLLEPQRTNLMIHSSNISSALTSQSNTTVTSDTTISPDGTQNADTVLFSNNSYRLRLFSIASSTNYTASLFFKNIDFSGTENITLNVSDGVYGSITATIRPSDGTVTFTRNILSWSTVAGDVKLIGNGWYRVTISGTSINGGGGWYEISSHSIKSVYLWGLQFEVGAYATTYIPTTNATATRLADTFTRNNIYTNGLISASGGTWYVELRNNVAYVRDNAGQIFIANNTSIFSATHVIAIGNFGFATSRVLIFSKNGGGFTAHYTTTEDNVKIAIKWNGTTADIFVNGVKIVSAFAFSIVNMEFLSCNGAINPTFIQAMQLYPTPLSDVDCEVLTGEIYTSYSSMATALGYTII